MITGDVRSGMLILFGAVGLVLLIASANVANLLLVRGEIRRPELALRVALGASRRRLASQIVSESLVLSLLAGIIGLAASWASLRALVAIAPGGLPRVDSIRIDAGVVLFVVAAGARDDAPCGVRPCARGLARQSLVSPAGRRSRGDGQHQTRPCGAGGGAGGIGCDRCCGGRARHPQPAAAAVNRTELGADRLVHGVARVASGSVRRPRTPSPVPRGGRERGSKRHRRLPRPRRSTPSPFSGVGWDVPIVTAEGQNAAQVAANGSLNLEAIQPGYFDTFGVTLVRGRPFDERDRDDAPAVAIVSEDVASRLWPGQDPIGKRLKMGDLESKDTWRTVVGVASRTRYRDLRASQATLYVPDTQLIVTAQSLVVRSTAPLSHVARCRS